MYEGVHAQLAHIHRASAVMLMVLAHGHSRGRFHKHARIDRAESAFTRLSYDGSV